MKLAKLCFVLLIASLSFSCTKTDEPVTKTAILQSKTWMISTVDATGYLSGRIYERGRTPEGSTYDLSKVRVTFKANGSADAIDNTGNLPTSGKWKLTNSDTKIEVSDTQNYLLDGIGEVNSVLATEFVFSGSRTVKGQTISATVRMIPAI